MFEWMVIGGASKSTNTPDWRPPRAWVDELAQAAWAVGCHVYEKDNLLRRWRQYPGHADVPPTLPSPFHYLTPTAAPDQRVEELVHVSSS